MAAGSTALTVSDLDLQPGGLIRELIEGDLFVSPPVTPYLENRISAVAQVLKEALRAKRAVVATDAPVLVTERTALVPDVAVWREGRGPAELPELVVELRTESTDRYALGPKRLVYSRARVPEYWFADPVPRRVYVMRDDPELPDYPWPPEVFGPGDLIDLSSFPEVKVAVDELFSR